VSHSQAATRPPGADLCSPIENGVEGAEIQTRKRPFAFILGRVCPEKGFEDAISACERARVPLLIAGTVFPYAEHRRYFETEIRPRLDRQRRWIGPVTGARKRRLLAEARCVLVPSRVAETSSLVAMEALAAGTPVIAYRVGALPEVVDHGQTGYIVADVEEMANAIRTVDSIDAALCRRRARERFSLDKMVSTYLQRYAELAGS
jgi:glycosyltransferase involved in cell wall biosynthesis